MEENKPGSDLYDIGRELLEKGKTSAGYEVENASKKKFLDNKERIEEEAEATKKSQEFTISTPNDKHLAKKHWYDFRDYVNKFPGWKARREHVCNKDIFSKIKLYEVCVKYTRPRAAKKKEQGVK